MKVILFILFFLFSTICFSQDCTSTKDTLYFINFFAIKNNGICYRVYGLIKTINEIKIEFTTLKKFSNSFYSYFIWTEWYFDIYMIKKCYSDSTNKIFSELYYDFYNQEKIMNKKDFKLNAILPGDSTKLIIHVFKLFGEFWILPKNINYFNNSDSYIFVSDEYKHDYYYKFKKIFQSYKLSRKEKKLFKTLFNCN